MTSKKKKWDAKKEDTYPHEQYRKNEKRLQTKGTNERKEQKEQMNEKNEKNKRTKRTKEQRKRMSY